MICKAKCRGKTDSIFVDIGSETLERVVEGDTPWYGEAPTSGGVIWASAMFSWWSIDKWTAGCWMWEFVPRSSEVSVLLLRPISPSIADWLGTLGCEYQGMGRSALAWTWDGRLGGRCYAGMAASKSPAQLLDTPLITHMAGADITTGPYDRNWIVLCR